MLSIEDHQVCLSPVLKIGGLMEGKVRIVIEGPKAAIINPASGKKLCMLCQLMMLCKK